MKKYTTIALAVLFVALSFSAGCKATPSAFPLSLATLGEIHSGEISYEERDGEIFVSIGDSSGDRHIHRLDYSGNSRQDTLEVLKKKQTELEKAEHQGAAAKIQKNENHH